MTEELRERAIRMAVDLRRDPETMATRSDALPRVGKELRINPDTRQDCVQQVEVEERHRPGVKTAEVQQIDGFECAA